MVKVRLAFFAHYVICKAYMFTVKPKYNLLGIKVFFQFEAINSDCLARCFYSGKFACHLSRALD